ncbi:hypothetical protein H5407_22455 [Mitsuaria sp. WAJ17]|uniref:hypothetical protein n=1 Tax=Mitsuaria sp. WAJ17 TaxID=2761452 RepID=UPI0016028134|nr:hypothetical protein [Mitsuaria sp. WAJ17]MBB2488007.1 hypothetical protein [Mitsuaria sp. WAJ17]
MADTTLPHVTALFPDRESAERAYQQVMDRGYRREDVSVMMSDETRHRLFPATGAPTTELGSKAAEGTGVGASIGGALGAIAAAIAAAGTTLAIPGLGLVIAGPLAAALAGAGLGGTAGGLVGALIGWSIPEERVKAYESGLREGGILLSLKPRSEEDARHVDAQWLALQGRHSSM